MTSIIASWILAVAAFAALAAVRGVATPARRNAGAGVGRANARTAATQPAALIENA